MQHALKVVMGYAKGTVHFIFDMLRDVPCLDVVFNVDISVVQGLKEDGAAGEDHSEEGGSLQQIADAGPNM